MAYLVIKHLLERLFTLLSRPRQCTPFLIPNPSPEPGVLHLLIGPSICIGKAQGNGSIKFSTHLGFARALSIPDNKN